MEKRIDRKPIKILVTDTHCDKDNLEDVEDIFDQAFDLADSLGIKKINHLGDIFTNRTGQTLKILLSFLKIAKKAEERQIKIEMIAGNHDKTNLESEESYLDLFHNINPFVEVITKYKVDFQPEGVHCHIPYFKENTKYLEVLEELLSDGELNERLQDLHLDHVDMPVYLYTHIAVNGVKNNGGDKVENDLKYSLFKPFAKVFIGHYHNSCRVGKNIFYIGSGKPKDFGEDDKKGFTIVYSDGHHEQIQAKFKKFVKVRIDLATTDRKSVLKLLEQYKDSEDNVRFIFEGNTEQFAQYEKDFILIKKSGIDLKREDKNVLKAMEAATTGGAIKFNYKLIKRYFMEFCVQNKEHITSERRSIGLKYIELLKDYQ